MPLTKILFGSTNVSTEWSINTTLVENAPDMYDVPMSTTGFYYNDSGTIRDATEVEILGQRITNQGVATAKTHLKDINKAEVEALILPTYPITQQLNIIRLEGADLTTMTAWIDDYRSQGSTYRASIDACVDVDALVALAPISWSTPA